MTSKLTSEWLQQKIAELESDRQRVDAYGLNDDGHKTLSAYRLALAALDSEPFAYIIQDKYERERGVEGHLSRSHISKYVSHDDINEHEIACTPLYRHAQPAPVVPDDVLMSLRKMDDEIISELDAEESACRAAMLQAGNSPEIPYGWVACSERMPEDEQEVLTRNKMGHCFVSFFDERSGLFFDRIDVAAACCIEHILVTHWMPLPAAPQEVKGC